PGVAPDPAGPVASRMAVRGDLRLRRARPGRTDARGSREMAVPARSVLVLPAGVRGADVPLVPARPDVPSLPERAGRGAGLPGALDEFRLPQHPQQSGRPAPRPPRRLVHRVGVAERLQAPGGGRLPEAITAAARIRVQRGAGG